MCCFFTTWCAAGGYLGIGGAVATEPYRDVVEFFVAGLQIGAVAGALVALLPAFLVWLLVRVVPGARVIKMFVLAHLRLILPFSVWHFFCAMNELSAASLEIYSGKPGWIDAWQGQMFGLTPGDWLAVAVMVNYLGLGFELLATERGD